MVSVGGIKTDIDIFGVINTSFTVSRLRHDIILHLSQQQEETNHFVQMAQPSSGVSGVVTGLITTHTFSFYIIQK